MSMYVQLLATALDAPRRSDDEWSSGAALAELLQHRSRLERATSGPSGSGWAPSAVADQLTYDVALIELARHHGIECDVQAFDPPHVGRAGLEDALATIGIRMGELVEEVQGSPKRR